MQGQNFTQLKPSATPLDDCGKRKLSGLAKAFPPLFHAANRQQLETGVAGHQWSVVIREGVTERKMVSAHPPPGCFEIAPFLIIVRV